MSTLTYPRRYVLGDLISHLEQENPERIVSIGFDNPHSYRGYYEDVAFEIKPDVTVGSMLDAAQSALGVTFQGWKGGDFVMHEYTYCWLVQSEGCTGESIGAVLMDFILAEAK